MIRHQQSRSGRSVLHALAGAILSLAAVPHAGASPVLWSGVQSPRAASASFDVSGTDLLVTLTNTSTSDVVDVTQVLTGVFFNVSGNALSLSRTSAVLAANSSVYFGTTDPGGGVGGEWAYSPDLSGTPGNRAYGIASARLGGLFGPHDMFPGTNLDGGHGAGGVNYGLTSMGDNLTTGTSAVTGNNPLIKDSVTFRLPGLPSGFDTSRITGVEFQYGTSLSDPSFAAQTAIPGPGTLALAGLAVGFPWSRRRRPN